MTSCVVGFAGLTHLGLVSAVCAAEKGFRTVGFDIDPGRIERLNAGIWPISEPGLSELAQRNTQKLTFTCAADALSTCDLVFVSADVPTDALGRADLESIERLLGTVRAGARGDATVVILSQVPPGFTRAQRAFDGPIYYQAETLIFGEAVRRALEPERYIVGSDHPERPLPAAYGEFLAAHACPILAMRYESAELAKVSINLFLAATISTTNMLAEICERIDADWSEIVPALRLDRRIGPHAYLTPGLGIAGGNLERDIATVLGLAGRHNADDGVAQAFLANSRRRGDWAGDAIATELLGDVPDALVAVWGLAYKENTHSTQGSPSLRTIARFPRARFRVHDPVASVSAVAHPFVVGVDDPLEALAGAQALLVLTPWPQYRAIAPSVVARAMCGRVVIDPHRMLDPVQAGAAGLRVLTLGRPAPVEVS